MVHGQDWTRLVLFCCILCCLLFWVVFRLCIFLYCFVFQYQSSDWLWGLSLKWPRSYHLGQTLQTDWIQQHSAFIFFQDVLHLFWNKYYNDKVCCRKTTTRRAITVPMLRCETLHRLLWIISRPTPLYSLRATFQLTHCGMCVNVDTSRHNLIYLWYCHISVFVTVVTVIRLKRFSSLFNSRYHHTQKNVNSRRSAWIYRDWKC